MKETKRYKVTEGQKSYEDYRKEFFADPQNRAIYEQEAAKVELWLQLVEARMAAGLTQAEVAKRLGVSQAQVARIEKRGYDAYTLTTLRRYVQALGDQFSLVVAVRKRKPTGAASRIGTGAARLVRDKTSRPVAP